MAKENNSKTKSKEPSESFFKRHKEKFENAGVFSLITIVAAVFVGTSAFYLPPVIPVVVGLIIILPIIIALCIESR